MNDLIALCADYCWEQDAVGRFTHLQRLRPEPDSRTEAVLEAAGFNGNRAVTVPMPMALHDALARRTTFRDIEWRWQFDAENICVLSVSGEPVWSDDGLFRGYRGIMRDVTVQSREVDKLRRFRAAAEASGDAIMLIDRESLRFIDVNDAACHSTGYTREELLRMGPHDFLKSDRQSIERDLDTVIAAIPQEIIGENKVKHRDGSEHLFEMRRRAICCDGRWIIVSTARDITRRKRAEKAAIRLGLMYATISGTNEAILHAKTPDELFRQVCEVAVRGGPIMHASVLLENPQSEWAEIVAVAGIGTDTLMASRVSFDENRPEGRGMVGTAFRTGTPCIINDFGSDERMRPWRSQLGKESVVAGATIPLVRKDKVIGVLLLYSREADAFDRDIVQMLQRMSRNIAFALDSLERDHERQHAVDALRTSEEKYRSILENIEEAYYEVDLSGSLLLCNEAFCRMFGYGMDELIGLNYAEYCTPIDGEQIYDYFNDVFRTGIPKKGIDWRMLHKNGKALLCEGSIHLVRDTSGVPVGFRGMLRDVTERREMEERIQHLANHDILTGLPNRMMFNQRLSDFVQRARRFERKFAVMFVDLDRFKAVNDTYGHDAGDILLKETARRLRESVRTADFVARLAGDEFVVIVDEPGDIHQLRTIAEKVVTALRLPVTLGGEPRQVSASVGVSVFPDDGGDEESLLKHADAAMYGVKHGGKDGFRIYLQDMVSES